MSAREADDVAGIPVSRARVDFVPTDVGEDGLSVGRVLCEEAAHLRKRCGDALHISVVESEPHAQHDAALEALVLVRTKSSRIVMPAAMEEERGDRRDLSLVEQARAGIPALAHVHDAHHDSGGARPLHPAAGAVHLAPVGADPAQQAARPRVALRDGVRGDEPEGALRTQKVKRATEEMGYQICVAGR